MPMFTDISDQSRFPGVRVFQTKMVAKGTAVALPGIGIFVSPEYTGTDLVKVLQHEYGHILDARRGFVQWGGKVLKYALFYVVIGVPSVISAMTNRHRHRYSWTEVRANRLAAMFFAEAYIFDEKQFPLGDSKE